MDLIKAIEALANNDMKGFISEMEKGRSDSLTSISNAFTSFANSLPSFDDLGAVDGLCDRLVRDAHEIEGGPPKIMAETRGGIAGWHCYYPSGRTLFWTPGGEGLAMLLMGLVTGYSELSEALFNAVKLAGAMSFLNRSSSVQRALGEVLERLGWPAGSAIVQAGKSNDPGLDLEMKAIHFEGGDK